MNKKILLVLLLVIVTGLSTVRAQYTPGMLSEETKVNIITVGPARPAYTMFGHTAIRLQDPARNIDRVYNYGTFSFGATNFYLKFLYGNLEYYLSVVAFEQFKQTNVGLGRSIVGQTLNLSQKQTNRLVKKLEQNSLPENRLYRYRFFRRNCVTQVRDLLSGQNIELAFGQTQATVLSAPTYRQMLSAYLTGRPWLQFGINLMLGAGADQPLTAREQNFLPNALHGTLANAAGPSGQPLVKSSKTIAKPRMQDPSSPIPPVAVLGAIFLLAAAFTATSFMLGLQGWWIDRILFGVVGSLGILMAFGSLFSQNAPLHHNWNLLWALPTHLLVAVGIPSLCQKWIRAYFLLTLALNIILMVGWTFIPQQIPSAVIPVIAAIMVRAAYRLYGTLETETNTSNLNLMERK